MIDKIEYAFPLADDTYDEGMTLRDYFAAKALHAVMVTSKGQTPAYLCQEAYHMADVMLKAREL
jgi:hypothetical protein